MGGVRGLGVLGLLLVAGGLAGCSPDAALLSQRQRLELEHLERMKELTRLEARLLALTATSREWGELGRRHEGVSEVACANAAEHLAAMEKHVAWQDEKARRARAQERLERAGAEAAPVKLSAAPSRERRPAN